MCFRLPLIDSFRFRKNRYLFSVWAGVLTFLLVSSSCYSQDYKVVNISLPEGLSQSSVYTISQDRTGFIWAGTQDGLNKYDGLSFKTYYNQPFDSTSLSSAYITSILNDSKGRCWIGTENNGLNLIVHPNEEKFIHFNREKNKVMEDDMVKTLFEDSKGNIIVGTIYGIYMIRISGNGTKESDFTFENLKTDTSGELFNTVSAIAEKDPTHYWIGTRTGLFLLEYKEKGSKFIAEYHSKESIISGSIMSLKKDPSGNIWIASSAGLYIIDHSNKISKVVPYQLWTAALCFLNDGSLRIAGGEGLYSISAEDVKNVFAKEPKVIRVMQSEPYLSGPLISVIEDKINKGLLWIGSESNGLVKLVPVFKKFNTNHLDSVMKVPFVFSLYKNSKNVLWIGTTTGLLRYDRLKNKYSIFTNDKKDPKSLPYNFVRIIAESEKGNLYLGSPAGLLKVENPESEKPSFKRIIINSSAPEAPVMHICKSKDKMFMVLPMRVFAYDEENKMSSEILHLTDSILQKYPGMVLSTMIVDNSDNIWLGTTNGLLFYRKTAAGYDSKNPEIFYHNQNDTTSLRCQVINDVTMTGDGSVWISTMNGFSKVITNGNKVTFKNYSTQNGLRNNAVYGALENPKDGSLWLSTNGGLTKIDPAKNTFSNYDLHDGLQSNEFNGGSYFRSFDNEFFFGGVKGYTSFYPEEIGTDAQPPLVYITSFQLPGDQIDLDPSAEKKIELKYNQNSFSVDFIALHFVDPEKNMFEYMLEGYQKEWTKSGKSHRINFSQLPPGEYIFKVKGSNNDGVYSAKADTLKIIIHSPFWKTPWFYAGVAVVILLLFWLMHLYRLKLKMQQIKEIENVRKEIAADFHDELGHKLTTISWFSEILQNKLQPDEQELNSYLAKIKDTSGSLYHTMKDLLWAMDPAKDSIADLYKQIRDFGQSLFDQTGVMFSSMEPPFGLNNENIPLEYKRHVLLIFKEAMHNSFKHSKGTKVNLSILRENNHVTIGLEDNGKGFSTDASVIGNGLKNVEKRTKLIKGKFLIDSGSQGTTIKLEIPLPN